MQAKKNETISTIIFIVSTLYVLEFFSDNLKEEMKRKWRSQDAI